ncbi:MAG: GGDEF domain-containing protein [candidate division FCPU426 bacterium]
MDENQPQNQDLLKAIELINRDLEKYLRDSIETLSQEQAWSQVEKAFTPLPCWEIMDCSKTDCPMHGDRGHRCWLSAGTLCEDKPSGSFVEKYRSCFSCPVFKQATRDPLRELWENINTVIFHLNEKARKLREMAIRDPLTGLYNRHFYNEVIPQEIARAERRNESLAFLVIDLDHLKDVNDRLGHLTGDKIISAAARLITQSCRKTDWVFRMGGDEFLVVMIKSDEDGVTKQIDRLKSAVEEWNQHPPEGVDFTLSLSIGHATCNPCGDATETLREADRKMYQSKKEKMSAREK